MKPSEIDETLRRIRVSPVRSLGQNFLHDRNLARWIVAQAKLGLEDFVVEIGPGLGALTEFALASGARVLAIEKDARLVDFLRGRFAEKNLAVVHADALEFDLRPLFGERSVKVISNLPYYVATPLLQKFTKYPSAISLWLFMLQKEMAKRISALPRTDDYGSLSLHMQLRHRVEYLRTIPASVFLPQPEVDSAIVKITPRPIAELPRVDGAAFDRLVRKGFSQRRKQLQKVLRDDLPEWETAAAVGSFSPKARAEELSLEQWLALSSLANPEMTTVASTTAAESFSVVDENDCVVGTAPRGEVHGNNLLHRAVHIFVFNRNGDLFLQKRSAWKDRHPLAWDSSAAGHVDAGEDYDSAALRELREELGIEAKLERVAKLSASERTGQEFIWLYRTEHDGPFHWPAFEIESGDFFPQEVIPRWIAARPDDFAPGFLECWKLFRAAEAHPT